MRILFIKKEKLHFRIFISKDSKTQRPGTVCVQNFWAPMNLPYIETPSVLFTVKSIQIFFIYEYLNLSLPCANERL